MTRHSSVGGSGVKKSAGRQEEGLEAWEESRGRGENFTTGRDYRPGAALRAPKEASAKRRWKGGRGTAGQPS